MTSDPVVLIPARLESRRLPGKALAELGGMPIVIRCANNAISAGSCMRLQR
jgi:3-deoxy-manno-octulosonate cytidylyltransferase (CMP-KDO synthetase)